MEKENLNTDSSSSGISGEWLALGVALGVVFGLSFDNLGLWLPIGAAVGVAIDSMRD
jgi:hypothetical protein